MSERTEAAKRAADQYAEKRLAGLLRESGFSRYHDSPRRWHKVGNDVILSVQLVCYYGTDLELYYGFQPIFYPFEFVDARMKLHDAVWTFFDAEQQYYQQVDSRRIPSLTRYDSIEKLVRDQKVSDYYPMILKELVLPALHQITDVRSCHKYYEKYYWGLYREDPWALFDSRFAVECVALGETETLRHYAECALLPIINSNRTDKTIPLELCGTQRADAEVLYRELRCTRFDTLSAFMEQSQMLNLSRIKRAKIPVCSLKGRLPAQSHSEEDEQAPVISITEHRG